MSGDVVWSGGYTTAGSGSASGIGALRRHRDGRLEWVGTAADAADPSFLCLDPRDASVVFAVDEGGHGVQSFRRAGEMSLEPLTRVATGGSSPCHIGARLHGGELLLDVACYGDGAIAVHRVASDGRIGEVEQVLPGAGSGPHPAQDGSHAHATLLVDGRVLSADLGSDQVHVHDVRDDGLLDRVASIALSGGTGPRDLMRHPSGDVWVLGEHGLDISVLRSVDGRLEHVATLPLVPAAAAPTIAGSQAAGLTLSTDGQRAYAGIRGAERIAVLGMRGGAPHPIGTIPTVGSWPRHHLLDGEFLYIANERSGQVVSLRLDPATDGAAELGEPEPVPTPTFLLFAD